MKYRPVRERLMAMVSQQPSGCWDWTGHLRGDQGYGGIQVGRKNYMAHRVSYELFVGPIPEGFQIDHLCRNRKCVNPEHLEAVTPQENIRRSHSHVARALITGRCKRDHLLAGDNLYRNPKGQRECRTCRRERRVAA